MVSHSTANTNHSAAPKPYFQRPIDAESQETQSNPHQQVTPQRTNLSLVNFTLHRIIGTGTFAEVYSARDNRNNRPVAIKVLTKSQCSAPKSLQRVFSEKTILKQTQHPNIVNYIGSFQDSHKLYLVMEYVQGGELYTLMREKGVFSRSETQVVTAEIVSALLYLHSEGVAYRDLKAENVLISATGHIKLADFGFAKRLKKDEKTYSLCGTPHCMAPEILNRSGHSFESDWWSLGVLVHELISGDTPFDGETPYEMYEHILTEAYAAPKEADNDTASLLAGLLTKDPSRRLKGREVTEHPFFRGVEWEGLELARPFYEPEVKSDQDDSHFDHYDAVHEVAPTRELDQSLFEGY